MAAKYWGLWLLGLATTAIAWFYTRQLYPHLPARLPAHWNAWGEIDGWAPRDQGIWPGLVFAGVLLLLWLAVGVLARRSFADPRLAATFHLFMLWMLFFATGLQWGLLEAGLNPAFPMPRFLMSNILLLLGMLGPLLWNVPRNPWIGIRTPGTLRSDAVWKPTHQLAGWTLLVGCLPGVMIAWLGSPLVALGWLMMLILIPVFYSMYLVQSGVGETREGGGTD